MGTTKLNLIKGTMVITIFAAVGKIIGAFFKIGLVNVVGSEGMGIYQLLFPLFVFFVIFASEGHSLAITVEIAKGQKDKVCAFKRYSLKALLFSSLVVGLSVVFLAPLFSKLQGENIPLFLYYELSVVIVIVSIVGYLKGIVRGYEAFKLYSVTETIEQLSKVFFSLILGLIFSRFGVGASIVGVFAGIILSSLVSAIFLVLRGRKYFSFKTIDKMLGTAEKRQYLSFVSLSSLAAIIIPALQFVDSILIVNILSKTIPAIDATKLLGISRGSVGAILNLPFFLLVSFEFLLLPNLTRTTGEGYFKKTALSIGIAFFVSVPFTMGYLLFSREIVSALYGGALSEAELQIAANLLKIGSLSLVFAALSQVVCIFLESNKKMFSTVLSSLIAGVLKIVCLVLLLPHISIYGAEISGVLFIMIECLINLIFAVRYKLFKKPVFIGLIFVGWGFVFAAIYCLKMLLGVVLGDVISLVVSTCFVGVFLLGVGLIIYKLKKQQLDSFISKLLTFE